eukprot:7376-Heterococcus_DN1.PRE.2
MNTVCPSGAEKRVQSAINCTCDSVLPYRATNSNLSKCKADFCCPPTKSCKKIEVYNISQQVACGLVLRADSSRCSSETDALSSVVLAL